jgi:hypothetical protein
MVVQTPDGNHDQQYEERNEYKHVPGRMIQKPPQRPQLFIGPDFASQLPFGQNDDSSPFDFAQGAE